jgi:ADP-ribose pyrophosphatase YjhB (NUDIX family)
MKYCCECGGRVEPRRSGQTVAERFVCTECGRCYFTSPRLAAACLVESGGKILLCRRGVEPGYGLWTLPGGFLEPGEGAGRGAVRETLEEASLDVEILRPYALFQIPAENLVQVIYLARPLGGALAPGPETLEVRLFDEAEIPWDSLALTSTGAALRQYYADRIIGEMGFLFVEIVQLG